MSEAHALEMGIASEVVDHVRHRRALGTKSTAIFVTLHASANLRSTQRLHSVRSKLLHIGRSRVAIAYGPTRTVILSADKTAPKVLQDLRRIDEFLREQDLGSVSYSSFAIPSESHELFRLLHTEGRDITPHATIGRRSRARTDEFDYLLEIERMLRAADISNLVRERPLYDFSTDVPKLVQNELVVDIAEIARLSRVNLRAKPWLFAEVTRLLDRRMLAHLVRDRLHNAVPISINLHVETVLSGKFRDVTEQIERQSSTPLSGELDFTEMQAFPEAASAAVSRLHEAGWSVVVDGVPGSYLVNHAPVLPTIEGLYKFDWRNSLPLDTAQLPSEETRRAVAATLAKLGVERCVMLHCHKRTVAENAFALGFRLLEGFEIPNFFAAKPAPEENRTSTAGGADEGKRAIVPGSIGATA